MPLANHGLVCTCQNYQQRGELCSAGTAVSRDEHLLQTPEHGGHKSFLT